MGFDHESYFFFYIQSKRLIIIGFEKKEDKAIRNTTIRENTKKCKKFTKRNLKNTEHNFVVNTVWSRKFSNLATRLRTITIIVRVTILLNFLNH